MCLGDRRPGDTRVLLFVVLLVTTLPPITFDKPMPLGEMQFAKVLLLLF